MKVTYKYETLNKEKLTKFYNVDNKYTVAVDNKNIRIIGFNAPEPADLDKFYKEVLELI